MNADIDEVMSQSVRLMWRKSNRKVVVLW